MRESKENSSFLENTKHNSNDSHLLQERLKELECLYKLFSILKDLNKSTDDVVEKILEIIPPAWQYPEITCARIGIFGDEYRTDNYQKTKWFIRKDISVNNEKVGSIWVHYLDKRAFENKGPFLSEEIKLLEAISERLGSYLQQKITENGLQTAIGKPEWKIIVDMISKTDPNLLFRITRKMLYHLSRIQNESIDNLMLELSCPIGEGSGTSEWCGINMPNPRKNLHQIMNVQKQVFEIAKRIIKPEEFSQLLTLWMKQDKARPLLLASQKRGIPLVEISSILNRFKEMSIEELQLASEDDISIRTNLLIRFFTSRLEYINIAKNYIVLDDLISLTERIVGPAQGSGKLGGKSSGVYLADRIISREKDLDPHLSKIKFAKSWYLTSDTMLDVIHYNTLEELGHIKYKDPAVIRKETPFIEQVFKNAMFPKEIIVGLRRILDEIGDKPIIVRSSSLLEDSFGAAFSGKYKSLFLTNQGPLDEKLNALTDAIGEVYASTLGPDPIEYRKERGLLDFNEEMSILIQEVVGKRVGPYYIPFFAGVVFSNNEFRWSPRIRREDGIVRMVMGLGTRAVDRVADDYPLLFSPKRPDIRVNTMADEILQYSQHYIDVINLEKDVLETVRVDDFLKRYGEEIPALNRYVSIYREGNLSKPAGLILDPSNSDMVVTFQGVIEGGDFVNQISKIMVLLEETLGTPVDVEFASDGDYLYILQCRPQSQSRFAQEVNIPKDIPLRRKLFTASRYVTTGIARNIEYIVYVSEDAYGNLNRREDMLSIGKIIGELNYKLPKRKFILIGPGRWGSRGDIKLGVPVQYGDINNTTALIEIARKKGRYLPELSFGTHFFQDLVEAGINYLPLYPDDQGAIFKENLFMGVPNRLEDFLPTWCDYKDVVRLIKVEDLSPGASLTLAMDGDSNFALGYLELPDHWKWRMKRVEDMATNLGADRYGVKALYIIGSTKSGLAGPTSDIDLLIHFEGDDDRLDDLTALLDEWDRRLVKENQERTGKSMDSILDVHIITDEDIINKTSWAIHINSVYSSAKEIPLQK